MTKTVREQMQDILLTRDSLMKRYTAQFVLDNEGWLSMIERVPSQYRDFGLRAVEHRLNTDLDDVEAPALIAAAFQSGDMDSVWETVNIPNLLAFSVVHSVRAVQCSGNELTVENLMAVLRVFALTVNTKGDVPFCMQEDNYTMHPLVANAIISDPVKRDELVSLMLSGTRDCLSAIRVLHQDDAPSLISGVL